jgi:hypothetical protein
VTRPIETVMSNRIADAPPEVFTVSWRAPWRGPRRYAMLTSSLGDPGRFVAYGTDGYMAFRVEGSWRADLSRFVARMAIDGVELIPPPHTALVFSPEQLTFPDPVTVQRCFDLRMGRAAA